MIGVNSCHSHHVERNRQLQKTVLSQAQVMSSDSDSNTTKGYAGIEDVGIRITFARDVLEDETEQCSAMLARTGTSYGWTRDTTS